jgi:glycosyltransferase involved in cell wall biosynthesis
VTKPIRNSFGFSSRPSSKGGPGAFQSRLESKLIANGWSIVYPDSGVTPEIILVNGNTKHIWWLFLAKIRGATIIFRLGGINWLYKHKAQFSVYSRIKTSLKLSLIPIIQSLLADGLIYQSEFSKKWLIKLGQSARLKKNCIIYNGVDTNLFKPVRFNGKGNQNLALICVEGNLDYTPYAISLLNHVQESFLQTDNIIEIRLYGDFEDYGMVDKLHPDIKYMGQIPRDEVQNVYNNAIYLSLDINPACPNAVLEALSSGIPVVGYDTGALSELVPGNAGIIVPYCGDPWKLDQPNFNGIVQAIHEIAQNYDYFSKNARRAALEKYSMEDIFEKYLLQISEFS